MHEADQIVEQIEASIPEQYQPTNKRAARILRKDIKKQVLSQHLAVQLSHYADQPSDGKKHLGRVVISGGTSLLFRVPGCRISRDLDIITSIKRDKMTRLLEETLSQDKDDPFTYKILEAEKRGAETVTPILSRCLMVIKNTPRLKWMRSEGFLRNIRIPKR